MAQAFTAARLKTGAWDVRHDLWVVLGVCVALFLARAGYWLWLSTYSLGPDEAQYWHWTTHLDWSYLSKPPLTTWLIALGTGVLGQTALGVKIFAMAGQGAVVLLGFLLARETGGRKAAWAAFALLTTVPLVVVGGLLMSPDAVLLPLWLGALLVLAKIVRGQDRLAMWVLLGVLVGLAGLAKYSAGIFFVLLGIYLLVEKRKWLLRQEVWASGLIALAMQLPVLVWNMQNGWVGVAHVLWQAEGGGTDKHGGLNTLLEFIGTQLMVLGPLTAVMIGAAWGWCLSTWKQRGVVERMLLLFTLPVFAVFVLMTLTAKVQANWPLLGTVPALVLVAYGFAALEKPQRKIGLLVMVGAVALNSVLGILLHDTGMVRALGIPLKMKNDPTKDMRGWREMGELLGAVVARTDRPLLLGVKYQSVGPLAFYTRNVEDVLYLNAEGRRATEYDLWQWPDVSGRLVVFANEAERLPDGVKEKFGQCQPWHKLGVEQEGVIVRRLYLWLCW